MTAPAPSPQNGERELLHWRISGRAFAVRTLVLLGVTMLACTQILPDLDWLTWCAASVVTAVFYMWLFDDFRIWSANRKTVWRLTNRAIYINDPATIDPLRLALNDIVAIGKLSLWSITLRLPNRQSITLPLVPDLRLTKARIAAACEAAA